MAAPRPFSFDPDLIERMLDWAEKRITDGPDPKAGARSFAEIDPNLRGSITANGLGAEAAFDMFTNQIVPTCRPFDHPSSLSFVAAAPSTASLAFDAVLGPAEIFGGNWDAGSGAIHAENQALAWLSGLAGWGQDSGGVFVAGGTLGNLSALHAARTRRANHVARPERWAILASAEAHSSIKAVADVMDVDLILANADTNGRLTKDAAQKAMVDTNRIFAIVANAGATNCGAVDDISGLADLAEENGIWLHIDGAYGLAAMADPNTRGVFDGIERAHSFIVDPHKWLFAPYDSCALVYRNARWGAGAHGQRAAYLDAIDSAEWNPSDYALHLTRRARGLPLWFSLATHGSDAYGAAIAQCLETAGQIANGINDMPGMNLILGPQLSVVLFRPDNITDGEMDAWAERNRRSGAILCLPTTWRGQKVFRLCIVNPLTNAPEVLNVLRTLT